KPEPKPPAPKAEPKPAAPPPAQPRQVELPRGDTNPQRAKETEALRNVFLDYAGAARSVAFRPDGQFLATGDDRALWVWDLSRPKDKKPLRLSGPTASVTAAAFSHDGRYLAGAFGGRANGLRLWQTSDWQARTTLPGYGAVALGRQGAALIVAGV